MSKKQATLAAFGFTKAVSHRGKETVVNIPKTTSEDEYKLKCKHCSQTFKNQQGLSVHVKCKHGHVTTAVMDNVLTDILPGPSNLATVPSTVDNSEVEVIEILDATPVERRRGSDVRKSFNNKFKARAIELVERGEKAIDVAEQLNVTRGQISKWLKMKDKIVKAAVDENKKMLTRIAKPSNKYNDLYKALNVKFLDARSEGRRIDFNWLWSKARVIYREQQGREDAVVKKHVIVTFIKRNHLKLRRVQRRKKKPKEAYRESLMKWHSTLRERLVKTSKGADYDPVYGAFKPSQRFNVDQSPLPFAIDTKKTYERIEPKNKENRNKNVWVSQPAPGLEKRQCTLQICFRPDGQQPKIAIIFRGQGKRLSAVEKESWHPDVDVYFQKNAWADTEFCVNWVKGTLKPSVEGRFVLFLDNLEGQIAEEFKKSVADIGGVCWYGLPGATDIWQPVDAGYAELLKVKVRQAHYKWLDSDENADKWYGEDKKFTASERRILITHWVGDAYRALIEEKYDDFRRKIFIKTGCLLTADGSGDDLVDPEGLPNYKVPPPSIIEPSPQRAESSVAEGVAKEKDDECFVDIEDDDEEIDMVVETIDPVEDDNRNIFDILNMESD